ncbi:MAG: transglycosylase SLT domain-containing protein [Succinivibrio sp.]|nr:transglycosylase SLT domain-containing protein [Succinivibrio sp.]
MSLKKSAVVLSFFISLPFAVQAAPTPAMSGNSEVAAFVKDSSRLAEQRDVYRRAVEAFKNGDEETGRQLMHSSTLKGYPLQVWLEYFYLSSDLQMHKFKQVKEFINSGKHHELADLLRGKYADYLADLGAYQQVLEIMPKQFKNPDVLGAAPLALQCRYQEALWQQGKADSGAVSLASSIYKNLKRPKDSCQGLLSLWSSHGYKSEAVVYQKFEQAYLGRRTQSSAQSLASELGYTKFADQVKLAMNYYDKPQNVLNMSGSSDAERRAAVTVFKRYANLQPDEARDDLSSFISSFRPTEVEKVQIYQVLARGLMDHDCTKADLEWADTHLSAAAYTDELRELRLRRAIWFAQWPLVYGLTSNLPQEQKNEINWRYWQAESAMRLGRSDGKSLMRKVAEDRSFYGFLAAQQLNIGSAYNNRGLNEDADWAEVSKNAAAQRFFELYAMDDSNASIEWREVAKYAPEDVAMLMAEWALTSGQVNYSIQSVVAGKRWDALNYRFPAPYMELYSKYARSTSVPITFLYGISRQESMMNPVIKSPAGAVGLMQLMPDTAKLVSRKNKWKYNGVKDLVVPDNNIRLGSAYIRNMLDKFDNNRILAAAAYNAGPNRIYRWASKDGLKRNAAMYIENIPFLETRKYVQNVLLYDSIYNKLLRDREEHILNTSELNYRY